MGLYKFKMLYQFNFNTFVIWVMITLTISIAHPSKKNLWCGKIEYISMLLRFHCIARFLAALGSGPIPRSLSGSCCWFVDDSWWCWQARSFCFLVACGPCNFVPICWCTVHVCVCVCDKWGGDLDAGWDGMGWNGMVAGWCWATRPLAVSWPSCWWCWLLVPAWWLVVGGSRIADWGPPIQNVAVPWLRMVCQANRISEDAFTLSWQLDRQVEVEVVGSHKSQSHSMERRAPFAATWCGEFQPHMVKNDMGNSSTE